MERALTHLAAGLGNGQASSRAGIYLFHALDGEEMEAGVVFIIHGWAWIHQVLDALGQLSVNIKDSG